MAFRTITVQQQGHIAILTLNRPDQGNRVTRLMLREIGDACGRVADDGSVRALVLTAAGPAFSAGWDASILNDASDGSAVAGDWFAPVAALPQPVIAAIGGAAISGGLELALAADVRIAAQGACFAFPETEWGIIPLAGGIQRLVRLVGRAVALEMLLLGEPLDAEGALAAGLVSRVVPAGRLMDDALALAGRVSERGPIAERYAKEAVHRGVEMPLEQALRYETDLTVILQTTEDRAEGVRAFIEKRQPRFTGR
jgi:enoyl-CoA hydratase/carnithine racemase